MSKPTTTAIRTHLTRYKLTPKNTKAWAQFCTGLDWDIIKPLTDMAAKAHTHPALAAGMVANQTRDEQIKATLTDHLEAKAE